MNRQYELCPSVLEQLAQRWLDVCETLQTSYQVPYTHFDDKAYFPAMACAAQKEQWGWFLSLMKGFLRSIKSRVYELPPASHVLVKAQLKFSYHLLANELHQASLDNASLHQQSAFFVPPFVEVDQNKGYLSFNTAIVNNTKFMV